MKRRMATAAVLAAGLLLTACSSDNGDEKDIVGVGEGQAAQTPEPEGEGEEGGEVAPDDGIERPDIQVADDLELIFEDRETGDPVKDAVLLDNEWQIKAVYEAVTTHDLENSSVYFYTREDALDWEMDFINSVIDRGLTDAGTLRYYNREVTLHEEDTATVAFCEDLTHVYTRELVSGNVVKDVDPDSPPTYNEALLKLDEDGIWRTLDITYERESAKCR